MFQGQDDIGHGVMEDMSTNACFSPSVLSRLSSINQRITDMQVRITGVPAVINLGFLHAEATLS